MFYPFWIFLGFAIATFVLAVTLMVQTLVSNAESTNVFVRVTSTSGDTLTYPFNGRVESTTLALFQTFVSSQIVSGTMTDVGSEPIPLKLLPSLIVGTSDPSYHLAGIYDNALAVIFLLQLGDNDTTSQIANSLLALMAIEGYFPSSATSADRNLNYGGLFRRYAIGTGRHSTAPPFSRVLQLQTQGVANNVCDQRDEAFYHSGDNAWVGMAFARFVLKFGDQGMPADLRHRYVNAALDQFNVIVLKHACDSGKFKGFYSQDETKTLLSADHTLIYALGQQLLRISDKFEDEVELRGQRPAIVDAQTTCVNLLGQLFYDQRVTKNDCFMTPEPEVEIDTAYYNFGTGSCGTSNVIDCQANIPLDAQTWTFLTGSDPSPGRGELSMNWAQEKCAVDDTDADPKGCGMISPKPCTIDNFTADQMFYGYRFSNVADGIQWDATGSALMAQYKRFTEGVAADEKESLKGFINVRLNSMVKVSNKYAQGGIPLAFRAASAYAGSLEGPQNSGFGINFFNSPSTSATMWCGLCLHYFNESANPSYIPFSTTSTRANPTGTFHEPTWIASYASSSRLACALTDTGPTEGCTFCQCQGQSSADATIRFYCELFNETDENKFKDPAGNAELANLGVFNRFQFPTLCTNPKVTICNTDTQAYGLQRLYKTWTTEGRCPSCGS